jgi:LmbE family N-acetylglucosaminyl deacetylase
MNFFKEYSKIMIIAAHPDDETLGCGGVIQKHLSSGSGIKILILGTGILSRPDADPNDIFKLREKSIKALKILGIDKDSIIFKDLPDNMFDSIPLLKITGLIENQIAEFQPELIYTHSVSDLNADHRLTFKAVMTACRPGLTSVKMINSFEVPSSTDFGKSISYKKFEPNLFINLDKEFSNKIKALSEYDSEMRKWPFPRSVKGVTCTAEYRGMESGLNLCEAFEIIRKIID